VSEANISITEDKVCAHCGHVLVIRERPDTIHFGEYWCRNCFSHNGWVKKEQNKDKRPQNKYEAHQLSEYCEFCLRYKQQLGEHETLEVHHKLPIKFGGQDTKANCIVLCTYCHKLCHMTQTYINEHLNGIFNMDESNQLKLF